MTGGTLVCVMVDTNAMESLYHGVGSSSDEGRGESSASTEGAIKRRPLRRACYDGGGVDGETCMSKLLVRSFSISLDGFGAGPNQDIANPLGVGGMALHKWFFDTLTFKRMHGQEGGNTGVDEDFAARSFANVGAWILGRNMFGPVRGPWRDE